MPTLAGPLYASGVPGVIGPVAEVTLATTSAAVTPGMWVCASGDPDSNEYTKATPSALNAAGSPAAMAVTAATPGNKFKIALQGDLVESSITGLAAGAPGKVAVATNAFSVRLARPRGGEYVGGKVDSEGNVTIQSEAHRATSPHMLYNVTAYGGAASTDPFARFFGKSGGATGVDNWQPIQDAITAMGNSGGILYFPARDDGEIATYLVGTAAHGPIPFGVGAAGNAKPIFARGDAGFFAPQSIIVGDHDVTTFRVYDFGDSPDGTSAIGSVFSYLEIAQPISYQYETWGFWKAHGGTVNVSTHMIPDEPHGSQGVYFIPNAGGTMAATSPVFPDEWQGSHVFPTGTQIYLTDHDIPGLVAPLKMTATIGGTSGNAPPAVWDQTPGNTTVDGTVTWTTEADNRVPESTFFWVPKFFAHGINSSTIIAVEHCRFSTINGDAVHIEASAGGSSTIGNGVRIQEVRCYVTAGAGIFFRGPDSNAGYTELVDGLQNGDYTIDDRSFLQNTHVAGQSAACVRGAYCAWENPSPVSKITFIGCYAEGGQPASRVRQPAYCIGGLHANGFTEDSGPQALDLLNQDAQSLSMYATRNIWGYTSNWPTPNAKRALGDKTLANPDNGFVFTVTGGTTFLEGNSQPVWNTTIGGTTADGGLTWTCTGASRSTIYEGFFKRPSVILHYAASNGGNTVPDFQLDYNDGSLSGSPGPGWTRVWSRDTNGDVIGGFSSPQAAEGPGWVWWFQVLFGAGAYRRAWTWGDGNVPTTGTHQVGDIDWNTASIAQGRPIGHVCTVAGTPGTWARFGEIGLSGDLQFSADLTVLPLGDINAAALADQTGLGFARASDGYSVQSSASSVILCSTGIDRPRVGQSGAAATRGLVLEESRINRLVYSRDPAQQGVGKWQAGTNDTQTANFAASVDGVAASATRHQTANGTYAAYQTGFAPVAGNAVFSAWMRAGVATGGLQIRFAGGTDVGVGAASGSVTYSRFDLKSTYSVGCTAIFNDGRAATIGGPGAGARDCVPDMLQLEDGAFPTEAIVNAAGVLATRAGEALWHPNIGLLESSRQMSVELKFIAKGASSEYAANMYLWYVDANNNAYIDVATLKVNCVIGGTTVTLGTAMSWARGDTVELFVQCGGAATTTAAYRINGGATTQLGTGTALGNSPASGVCYFFCAGLTGQLSSWIQTINTYVSGKKPSWA